MIKIKKLVSAHKTTIVITIGWFFLALLSVINGETTFGIFFGIIGLVIILATKYPPTKVAILPKYAKNKFLKTCFIITINLSLLAGIYYCFTSLNKTNAEKSRFCAQLKVESLLKSPSTAKFPFISNPIKDKTKEIYNVSGYLDSQNGFGAMIRSNFYCTVKFEKPHCETECFLF